MSEVHNPTPSAPPSGSPVASDAAATSLATMLQNYRAAQDALKTAPVEHILLGFLDILMQPHVQSAIGQMQPLLDVLPISHPLRPQIEAFVNVGKLLPSQLRAQIPNG